MKSTTALSITVIALFAEIACSGVSFVEEDEVRGGRAGAVSEPEGSGGVSGSASPSVGGAAGSPGGHGGEPAMLAGSAGAPGGHGGREHPPDGGAGLLEQGGNGGAQDASAGAAGVSHVQAGAAGTLIGSSGNGGTESDAGTPDATVSDASEDATEDVVEDVTEEDAEEPDASAPDADASDAADIDADEPDTSVPDADIPDATEDVVEEDVVEAPECYESGVRIRWETQGGSPVVSADGTANGSGGGDLIEGICGPEDDLDPSPYVFDCCFETEWYAGNTYLLALFRLTNGSTSCNVEGCLPYSDYQIWVNGNQVTASFGSIPSCGVQGECPHMLVVYLPTQFQDP